MSKNKNKRKNAKKTKHAEFEFDVLVRTVTQPHIESFIYGFLQSRGFDLYPRVRETEKGWKIALYFDRGEKGWQRVFQLQIDGKEEPSHFTLALALSNHLYSSGVQPRTPAPMGEILNKMMRNQILGQLQDGISPETGMQLLNNISGNFTRHLRPAGMQIDFGDGVEPGTAPEIDPAMEAEIAKLMAKADGNPDAKEELERLMKAAGIQPGKGEVAKGEELEVDDDTAEELNEELAGETGEPDAGEPGKAFDEDCESKIPDHLPGYTCTCGKRKVGATGDTHHCDACGLDHVRIDGRWMGADIAKLLEKTDADEVFEE